MKQSVTICIPAYNEAKNIEAILRSILQQKQVNFLLSSILVYSDGSTDDTVKLAQAVGDSRIRVLAGEARMGKAHALNTLLGQCTSDIAITMDADSTILDSELLVKMVRRFQETRADLVSGKGMPLPPKSFVEKIQVFGIAVWQDIIAHTPHSEMYTCGGQLVGFTPSVYAQIQYPATSADDVYPFLWAVERNLTHTFAPDAKIYFQLPTTIRDYWKQYKRFLNADYSIAKLFPKSLLQKYYVIGYKQKCMGYVRALVTNPGYALAYALLLVSPKLVVALHKHDTGGLWDIVESTKFLN